MVSQPAAGAKDQQVLHGAAILARVRGFLITSALVLAIIGIGVGIESGSHPAGLFGTGQSAFIAAFPEQPSLATYESPNLGFGYFEPGVFSEVQLWGSDSSSSVLVAELQRNTGTGARRFGEDGQAAPLARSSQRRRGLRFNQSRDGLNPSYLAG